MSNIVKRLMDLVFSVIVLILLLPLFILIALMIKIDSTGPVLFKQKRLTKNGKVFQIYKFRSMIIDAENTGSGLFNFENDKRVTRIGKIIRKTSLDELPQIFNVLKGDMSLVGPRPSVLNEIGDYNDLNEKYRKRYNMKGGITGLAQISGRNELPWSIKINYDNEYIDLFKKYGIFIDIKILFMTVISVFNSKDIYEVKNEQYIGLTEEQISIIETKKIITEATYKGEKNE
jgi:lipopolysaccharide/colanic/teichoic acid biosynthesis glycosyltransferase